MRRWVLPFLLLPGLVAGTAGGAEAPEAVQVTASGEKTTPLTDPKSPGMVLSQHTLQFSSSRHRYSLAYSIVEDPAGVRPSQRPDEGYIGMPLPVGCNWYGGGFLDVVVNGRSLGATKARRVGAAEQGERGSGDILWVLPEGQVRLRFLLEPTTRYLACELRLAPVAAFRDVAVHLRCYPSFFTAWHKRDGWRQILGAQQRVEQGAAQGWDFARNPWLLYQDRLFDVAHNSQDSAGPCAFACLPEQVQALRVDPGSYGVGTAVTLKPAVPSLRFAFWDFHQVSNADALAELRQNGAAIVAHLRQLDFGDRNVASFDPVAERATLEALLAQSSAPDQFRQTYRPVFEQIAAGLKTLESGDMQAEQTVGDLIRQYRDMSWDLKIDALLHD